jgi:hypothetical protein
LQAIKNADVPIHTVFTEDDSYVSLRHWLRCTTRCAILSGLRFVSITYILISVSKQLINQRFAHRTSFVSSVAIRFAGGVALGGVSVGGKDPK